MSMWTHYDQRFGDTNPVEWMFLSLSDRTNLSRSLVAGRKQIQLWSSFWTLSETAWRKTLRFSSEKRRKCHIFLNKTLTVYLETLKCNNHTCIQTAPPVWLCWWTWRTGVCMFVRLCCVCWRPGWRITLLPWPAALSFHWVNSPGVPAPSCPVPSLGVDINICERTMPCVCCCKGLQQPSSWIVSLIQITTERWN